MSTARALNTGLPRARVSARQAPSLLFFASSLHPSIDDISVRRTRRDILPRALNPLTSHIRQLYDAAGSEAWISRLVFQGTTPSAQAAVPPSDVSGNGGAAETAGRAPERTDFFADPANWLDEKLIPQGDPAGFTGVRRLQIGGTMRRKGGGVFGSSKCAEETGGEGRRDGRRGQ